MKVSNSHQEVRKGSRKSEGRNKKPCCVKEAGGKEEQKKNNVRGLGFFKAVINYDGCEADIQELYKNTCINTDRTIAQKKIFRNCFYINLRQNNTVRKKLIESKEDSQHQAGDRNNKEDKRHSVSESDCHNLKIT